MNMTNNEETRLKHSLLPPFVEGVMDSASCASMEAPVHMEEGRIPMENNEENPNRSVRKGYAKPHLKGDALKCYDLEVTNSRIIEAYDRAMSGGTKEWDDYVVVVYEELENLIKKHVAMHLSYGKVEFEDLMAEGKLAILEKIQTYDPRRAMPSSYFGPKIDEMMRKCNHRESPLTDHYNAMLKKLNETAKEYGYEDCHDPKLDPAALSILSGIPLATVVNTIEQDKIRLGSMEAMDPDEHYFSSSFPTPDKSFEEKESSRLINEAFNSLDKYEQFIFSKMEIETERDSKGNEKHWSVRKMVKFLSNPEVIAFFGLKKAPDNNAVCSDLEIVKQKLRHYPGMKQRFGYEILRKSPSSYTEFRQAEDDEIESAIESGIISL